MSALFNLTRIATVKTVADFRAHLAVIEIEAEAPEPAIHQHRKTISKNSPT